MPAKFFALGLVALPFAACTTLQPASPSKPDPQKTASLYKVETVKVEHGLASWYRDHRTASQERFVGNAMAAAHKTLKFGTKVRVVDLKTNKSLIVRINDRGPYIRGRVIDLTVGAARKLGMYDRGIARVRVEVLKEIPLLEKPNLHTKTRPKSQDYAAAAPRSPLAQASRL